MSEPQERSPNKGLWGKNYSLHWVPSTQKQMQWRTRDCGLEDRKTWVRVERRGDLTACHPLAVGRTGQVPFSAVVAPSGRSPDRMFCRQQGQVSLAPLLGLPHMLRLSHPTSIPTSPELRASASASPRNEDDDILILPRAARRSCKDPLR